MFKNLLLLAAAISLSLQLFAQQENYIPGQFIIQLGPEQSAQALAKDLALVNGKQTGLKASDELSAHMRAWLYEFDFTSISEEEMKFAFDRHPGVEIVQFNHIVELREVPNDPNFGDQWHHVNGNDSDIDSDEAWEITTGGTTSFGDEIVVCVIEGANLLHPDLDPNRWVNENEIPDNGIDDDANGFIDDYEGWNVSSEDDGDVFNGGHGTNVAGMIGAVGDNETGVAGINWNVKIMSVAGENIFDEASVIEAYNYPLVQRKLYDETGGERGAFVVATNASWGIDNGDPSTIPLWCNFYDTLGTYGILNCGATANNNVNIDVVGDIPTACSSPYMVSVTATNNNDQRTFSAYGATTVDLGAPGESVWTTSGSNGTTSTSGTSFASPLTAGAIALLYSVPCPSFMSIVQSSPQTGADLILNALYDGVDPVPGLEGETVTGGRLNVFNSLNILLNNCASDECLTPFGVSLSSEDGVDHTITWGSIESMESFDLRYRVVGDEEWILVEGLAENSYSLEGLEWCTDYEFELSATCGEEMSEWTNTYYISTDGCCVAPETGLISLDAIGETSATISWPSVLAAESYEVLIEDEDGIITPYTGILDNELVIGGLTPCSSYIFSVQSICAGEESSGIIGTFPFNTFGCGACTDLTFCEGSGNTQDEYIDRFALNSIDNTSGDDSGYGDYTSLSTELMRGAEYTLDLAPGFTGTLYEEYFVVWLDMNQDGEFSENEIIFESEEASELAITAQITIPEDTPLGNTRLRASMAWGGGFFFDPQGPCDELSYGEYEDYCINVEENTGVANIESLVQSVYPNPGNGQFTFLMKDFGSYTLEVFDMSGRLAAKSSFNSQRENVDLSALSEGMYSYRISEGNSFSDSGRLIIMK